MHNLECNRVNAVSSDLHVVNNGSIKKSSKGMKYSKLKKSKKKVVQESSKLFLNAQN